jgi:hypothetical protein
VDFFRSCRDAPCGRLVLEEALLIYFLADDHFDSRPGYHLYEKIKGDFDIKFFEDDISLLAKSGFLKDCDLLIINLICGLGKLSQPGPDVEVEVKNYCMSGKPLFLIHAGSAAFANWAWWRKLTGLRWVRENDPEGMAASVHPVKDFSVKKTSSKHTLMKELKGFDLKEDEIYTKLAKTADIDVLLETEIEEGVFPMAYASKNQWGGKVIGFLPGHKPEAFENKDLVLDVVEIIKYLSL